MMAATVVAKLSCVLCIFAFGAVSGKFFFEARFDKDNELDNWVQSKHKDDYGKFEITAGKFYGDEKKDRGMQTSQDAKFYSVSAALKESVSAGVDKPFVVQFSVKHEQNIDCGGGYVKLFPDDFDQKEMHGESPYYIMFGPDICGMTKKVHVILNYNGQNHLLTKEINCKSDEFTHLYTLILNTDKTYKVLIDNEEAQSGELENDWSFLPPKTIKDPDHVKPDDWVDEAMIDDPNDKKPEDWDQPEHIPDPDAVKPEDWDDEMDGEWEPSMIDNPDYKGEWKPKQIDNPAYKGEWKQNEIPNPDYHPEELKKVAVYPNIKYIGLDLWQVKSGTIFDNIIITNDVEEAQKDAENYFAKTVEPEKKMKETQDEEKMKADEKETPGEDDEDMEEEDEEGDAFDEDEETKKPSAKEEL